MYRISLRSRIRMRKPRVSASAIECWSSLMEIGSIEPFRATTATRGRVLTVFRRQFSGILPSFQIKMGYLRRPGPEVGHGIHWSDPHAPETLGHAWVTRVGACYTARATARRSLQTMAISDLQ